MLGQVHLARGEDEPAEAAFYQSLQLLSDLNSEYEVARTQLALAHLAVKTVFTEDTRKLFAQALETFEKLGTQVDLVEARGLEQQLQNKATDSTKLIDSET